MIYQKGKEHQRLQTENAALTAQNKFLEDWLGVTFNALEAHAERTASDQKQLNALKQRISTLDEYVSTLEDRDSVCLAGPDTDRLRDLWDPSPGTPSASPR